MSDLFGALNSLSVPNVKTSVAPGSEAERINQVLSSYRRRYSSLNRRRPGAVARARSNPAARAQLAKIDRQRTDLRRAIIKLRKRVPGAAGPPNLGDRDVRGYIRTLFTNHGLPKSLADWAYNVLVEGASGTEMVQRMYERPEFKSRFKALFEYRRLNPDAPAISPAEVLAFEREGAQRMRAAGMPPQFYDHWSDFVPIIASGQSMGELAERIEEGFQRVNTAPRGVRDAFTSFFGPSGDAALAAFFLHPAKALPALRLQVRAAEAAGAGFNFGFTLQRERAGEIGEAGYDYGAAQDRFANLWQIAPMFQETVGEARVGEDLEIMDEGVSALFGLGGAGDALKAIEQRREERKAAFGGGGGSQGSIEEGARGLGPAR